jgi:predicted P-loop ATPase
MSTESIYIPAEGGPTTKAATSVFRFPPDPLVAQVRDNLPSDYRQGGQKPYATAAATMAVMEASSTWVDHVRWNEMAHVIEYDGKPWVDELTAAALEWFEVHRVSTTKEVFEASLSRLALARSFHPVKMYLEAVPPVDADDPAILAELLQAIGIDPADLERRRDAYVDMLTAWLTARVARVYEPGCRVDQVLTLAGEQNLAKSGFFKALCPDEMWSGTMGASRLDDNAKFGLAGKWSMVFEELPRSRKDKDAFKAFITDPTDYYRRPYGRHFRTVPRQVVFGATINPVDGFLDDPTGERRLAVIHVARMIDWQWVIANRDRINAWSLARYRAGKPCQPQRESIVALQEGCWTHDDWEDVVEEVEAHAIVDNDADQIVITVDVVYRKLGIEMKDRDTRSNARITTILKRRGYTTAKPYVKVEGSTKRKQVRAWVKPKPATTVDQLPSADMLTGITTADNVIELLKRTSLR